jgi:hypothetical protein
MREINKGVISCLALILLAAFSVNAQKKDSQLKDHYKDIEVVTFDVKEGVKFPTEHLSGMMDEIVKELQDLKKFKEVYRAGATPDNPADPTLRLTGTVIKYTAGSQAKRYLIGFGAGKTKVVAHVKFIDKATGNVVFEKDVDGKVVIGIFGGQSKTSLRDVGKETAEVAKKQFF